MKIVSWNVNGINSCFNKGLFNFMHKEDADVYCFQEVKSSPKDNSRYEFKGYKLYWLYGERNGYSGLAVYSRLKPLRVVEGLENKDIDKEARVLTLEFKDFYLINAYFPHSNRELSRLKFKLKFNDIFLDFCEKLRKNKPIVIASDFNVAHKEIDLRNAKANMKNAGFTLDERNWFTGFLGKGYIDSFREFNTEGENYTWWSYRNNARKRNIGWRIDYFVVSSELKKKLLDCKILKDIAGSDHCPISLNIKS